jgi:hypothetical protein
LIGNGDVQDRKLMANQTFSTLFRMPAAGITSLDTWKTEHKILENIIVSETGLATVLSDILIGYIGSSYEAALVTISQDACIGKFIDGLSRKNAKLIIKIVIQTLNYITRIIGYPKYTCSTATLEEIIVLMLAIPTYDDWSAASGGGKVADIYYQILMLAWPPRSRAATKIDRRM